MNPLRLPDFPNPPSPKVPLGFKLWFAFCALLSLGVLGSVGYVLFHFIQKYW